MIYDDAYHNFSNLESVVRKTTKDLREHKNEFDSIAVRGVSGVLVGAPVALRLKKPLVVVRKPEDARHSPRQVENIDNIGKRYIFLDDFVSLGATRKAVHEAIDWEMGGFYGPKMVAQYLYEDEAYTSFTE